MIDIRDFLEKYGKGIEQGTRPNQFSSKPITYDFSDADIEKFNEIYKELLHSDLNKLERTVGGSIKVCRSNQYSWDCLTSKLGVRITVCIDGYLFVFRVGRPKFNESKMQGWKAWKIFFKLCKENGIDLMDYTIDNGDRKSVV